MHAVTKPACSSFCFKTSNESGSNYNHFNLNELRNSLDMVSIRTADNAVAGDSDITTQSCDGDLTGKLCIGAIEKRVRNLEKRKTKLDGYKQKLVDREKLAKEQLEALEKYESVCSNLDFAREVHKQILSIVTEIGNVETENHRIGSSCSKVGSFDVEEVVMLQSVLGNSKQTQLLRSCDILRSEELASLLEFGNLISVSGELSPDDIKSIASHLCKYASREDLPVVGTTYEKLFDLVHKIVDDYSSHQPKNAPQTVKVADSVTWIDHPENDKARTSAVSSEGGSCSSSVEEPKVLCCRSLQDILKGMEGEYTFLQESEVYGDASRQQVAHEIPEGAPVADGGGQGPAPVCVVGVDGAFAVGAHPMSSTVFLPKYVTIPYSNAVYAPSNTLPLAHYTVPAFTSYDYNLQNQMPFQTVFHHAIINGTTYFHQPGTVYADQTASDPYNASQAEEYPDAAEAETSAKVFYPPQYDSDGAQHPPYEPRSEDRESEFEESAEVPPGPSPMATPTCVLQPSEEVPAGDEGSPPRPTHRSWQYNNRVWGGRGGYRGQRNFQNQSRYGKSRSDHGDQSGGYRGYSRPQRFHNGSSHQQE